jgi:hypothetical protein
MCNCGFKNTENAKFCSNCGEKLEQGNKIKKIIPQMLTIKDAHTKIFNKKISMSKIYSLVKTKDLPHCNLNGRILLDVDKTIEWWNLKLNESIEPLSLKGLRKIL